MSEIRLAQKGEIVRQKELWKRCFGDPDNYIDFYYSNRYEEDETAVLLHNGELSAMLTMIPVKTVISAGRSYKTAMLYAIATDPKCRKRGFAAQLMEFSERYLRAKNNLFSVLVPAEAQLFNYYRKQGFQEGFYIREGLLNSANSAGLPVHNAYHCTISSAAPEEYNRLREKQLNGRLYISYADEDIAYQKKLSQLSGSDIYKADIEGIQGCLAVEKITSDKVLIKEILLPEEYINAAIKKIVQYLPAKEYILRTPAWISENLGGAIRAFGMIKMPGDIDLEIKAENLGYLGFAFD